jgi:putative glutamine amidotransferase
MAFAMKRPVILVSTPDSGGIAAWWFIKLGVALAGGRALRATPAKSPPLCTAEGLIVSGGSDVFPELYGQQPQQKKKTGILPPRHLLKRVAGSVILPVFLFLLRRLLSLKQAPRHDRPRDALEMSLITQAETLGMPVLGICRGMQLINVVRGGSLHQSIADFYEDVRHPHTVLPHKRIFIVKGSHLQSFFPYTSLKVNALHHQAVDRLGTGLSVAARDEAGVTQAIIDEKKPFFVGVQWHPEYMPQHNSQRSLFTCLVRHARNYGRYKENHETPAPDGKQDNR